MDKFDKKQFQKTGDGHIMAIAAGAKMENLGHTKMMHDFDSGLMYEEPFLYVDMEGHRFCNEDTGFVYMGNITKYTPKYNGNNVDSNHPDGSQGWYCQIYDSDYMSYNTRSSVGRADQVHPPARWRILRASLPTAGHLQGRHPGRAGRPAGHPRRCAGGERRPLQ